MTTGTVSKVAVSEETYRSDLAYSASDLKVITATNPATLWDSKFNPSAPKRTYTPALRIGKFIHTAVLEPDELHSRYGVVTDRRTKSGKADAAYLESVGAEAVNPSEMQMANDIVEAIKTHPIAGPLFEKGAPEQSTWWDHEDTGLTCKCRTDWAFDDTIVDLKTTAEGGAHPDVFAKSVGKFLYHLQAAHYLEGTGADRFIFVAVEKVHPYNIGVYELDADSLGEGLALQRVALSEVYECLEKDSWPGYSNKETGVTQISIPSWAFKIDGAL